MNVEGDALHRLRKKSVLQTTDLDRAELEAVLGLAHRFFDLDRRGVKTPLCASELAYALFFDNSTRTKSAWAGAAARLGMSPVIVDGSSTQVAHGETVVETGAMLGMNAHAMGVRHDLILGAGQPFLRDIKRGIDDYLAHTHEARAVPVVNLQCDVDHPTQTLADALWVRERLGGLAGRKVAVTWAYSPSYAKPLSVPQGLCMLLPRFGAEVVLAHPPGYRLQSQCLDAAAKGAADGGGSFRVVDDMDEAFADAEVVYPKSWGPYDLMLERVSANEARDDEALRDVERRMLDENAKHKAWMCDEAKMERTRNALYMHCLPADIGAEVSEGVMERFRFDVAQEAQRKVYVIMALLAAAKVPDLDERLDAMTHGS